MARDDPKTRYPFPPEGVAYAPFPATVPWDTPIAELQWWLKIECGCGENSSHPLRLMAARVGWKRTLRTIVPRLTCKKCGGRPKSIYLDRDGTGAAKQNYSAAAPRLPMVIGGRMLVD